MFVILELLSIESFVPSSNTKAVLGKNLSDDKRVRKVLIAIIFLRFVVIANNRISA